MQVYLSGSDMGNTVEEVDALVKKHEAFEKLLFTQNEKVRFIFSYQTNMHKLYPFSSFVQSSYKCKIF